MHKDFAEQNQEIDATKISSFEVLYFYYTQFLNFINFINFLQFLNFLLPLLLRAPSNKNPLKFQ